MKLVITIPAFNEENTIGDVIDEIPKKIKGIKSIKVLVIDDGSTDRTAEIAKKKGAAVLKNRDNFGLAVTFKRGFERALEMGADIIVNTDADMQYNQKQIPLLLSPLLEGKADIVLGSRFKGKIEYMPLRKRCGNRVSTWAVRRVSGLPISDAQTGFRAFSREAAIKMNVQSTHTYVQETILQAAAHKLVISEVPIDFRKRVDSSRLISNIGIYAKRALYTLLMGYLNYKPFKIFFTIGIIFLILGLAAGFKVLIHFFNTGLVSPFLPTAVLTAILVIFGFQVIVTGLLAEMIKSKRMLEEESLFILKKRKYGMKKHKRP